MLYCAWRVCPRHTMKCRTCLCAANFVVLVCFHSPFFFICFYKALHWIIYIYNDCQKFDTYINISIYISIKVYFYACHIPYKTFLLPIFFAFAHYLQDPFALSVCAFVWRCYWLTIVYLLCVFAIHQLTKHPKGERESEIVHKYNHRPIQTTSSIHNYTQMITEALHENVKTKYVSERKSFGIDICIKSDCDVSFQS